MIGSGVPIFRRADPGAAGDWPRPGLRAALARERDELGVVARRQVEAAVLPSRRRARPPWRPRSAPATRRRSSTRCSAAPPASRRRAASAARPPAPAVTCSRSPGRNTIIRAASKSWPPITTLARDDVEPAVLVLVRQRQLRPGRQLDVGVEHLVEHLDRRPLAPGASRGSAAPSRPRPRSPAAPPWPACSKPAGVVLGRLGQRHPGLDAEQRMRMLRGSRRWSARNG